MGSGEDQQAHVDPESRFGPGVSFISVHRKANKGTSDGTGLRGRVVEQTHGV